MMIAGEAYLFYLKALSPSRNLAIQMVKVGIVAGLWMVTIMDGLSRNKRMEKPWFEVLVEALFCALFR